MHVATQHAVHCKGVWGQVPPRKFCKIVQFGASWCIYFDQMILKIIPKITIFKKKLMILPARLLYGVFKLPEKILKT